MINRKVRLLFLFCFIICLCTFSNQVYAVEIEASSQDVNKMLNHSGNSSSFISTYSVDYSKENSSVTDKLIKEIQEEISNILVGASSSDTSFDLRDRISIEAHDQMNTEECWTFATFSSMETNLKLKYGSSPDFSERHMDYATSQSFNNGNNEKAYNRKVSDGGSFTISMAYLTNGQGAVLEDEMPFENNMNDISINDIDIEPSYYVKGYEALPSIYKTTMDGNIIYSNGMDKIYTEEDVNNIRKQIKEHIIHEGAIATYIASNAQYYSSPNIIDSNAFYCDDITDPVNHAVTIVGWDDNYSRDNFTGKSKPTRDGAYLVLNSYSENFFQGGYLWISYEDVWVEALLYGITESAKTDYYKLYQHDFFGGNVPITLNAEDYDVKNTGYYASVYDRNNSQAQELLTEVAVSTNQPCRFEIYVNPNNGSLSEENLIKVATTERLQPGYNTIAISPVLLDGEQFAVVVKHIVDEDEQYYFMIEAQLDGTFYTQASSQKGDSMVSIDGNTWYNLGDLGFVQYGDYRVNLATADVCIKAFTTENNITSSDYLVSEDGYITRIYDETTIDQFMNKVNFLEDKDMAIYNKEGELIEDKTIFVGTGMIFKVKDKQYKLVVRGDLSGDGTISLLDLSKQIAHYTGIEGFILKEEYDKAADMNLDGNLSIIDVSQLLVTYTYK